MTTEQLVFIVPYLMSALLSLGVAFYAWQRRSTTGAAAFAIYALAEGVATLGYIMETVSGTLAATHDLIRVVLVDDYQPMHTAIKVILEAVPDISFVGDGYDGSEVVSLVEQLNPDVLLMEVVMLDMNGLKILVLSNVQEYETIVAMLQAVASGYVVKGELAEDLITTIRATLEGKSDFSPEVSAQLISHTSHADQPNFGLTAREQEVIRLLASGLNHGQIALSLRISVTTVKFHISNIERKLGVETRSQALVVAARHGLV